MQFAAARGVAFAVVPCCVMPSLFPGRRQFWRADGANRARGVRGYGTYMRYLAEVVVLIKHRQPLNQERDARCARLIKRQRLNLEDARCARLIERQPLDQEDARCARII